ncbi:four helix bundle protein [Fluviicola chungangensis]|uniref:Four helix bundle protein n=1 Tax=Fluviicola chungangensis TaxID=2597671 RepID=A0A556N0B8_9FLAO|nr:four helix bundle protein [Fluviicola chungangensis]TSJ45469.1 four helix bundle protein [Fluviicola chungangensis]
MSLKPIDIRERTFQFALQTFRICEQINEVEKQFIITKQLAKSASSVGANVREARNAESKNDFIHKLSIALKECDESIYWMELLIELSKSKKEELIELRKESDQVMRILSAIIIKSKANSTWIKR